MTTKEALTELRKKPCRCVNCGECHGSGHVTVDSEDHWPEEEVVSCGECNGGVVELCDRCREIDELEESGL